MHGCTRACRSVLHECSEQSRAGGSGQIVVHPAFSATKGERSVVRRAAQDVAVAAVSAGLVAGGISTVVAPVLAVVLVVGHVAVRGVTRLVERRVPVSTADQKDHLEQLHLTQASFCCVCDVGMGVGERFVSIFPFTSLSTHLLCLSPAYLFYLSFVCLSAPVPVSICFER